MSLKSELQSIKDSCDVALAVLFQNSKTSFEVVGIDYSIPKANLPQQLVDKLNDDINAALQNIKARAPTLPNSV
jgi:hypothetical protein